MSNIVVPPLGESVIEARVSKWLKKEGDRVETGEPVVELETEKIDLEVGSDHGGVLTSIKRQEGEDVKVGELLGVVDENAAAAPSGNGNRAQATPAAPQAPKAPQAPSEDRRATPTARRVAREHDVNLDAVQGSGTAGRVMKQDVQKAVAPSAPQAPHAVGAASPATPSPAPSPP